ncbi:hypothetical protein GGX14DRAFT_609367 [Mycena pura]|uniref:Uncharacterized protein n=1 Tax=Mycena pura TaxID=153505 RepID=A0AAD6Y0Y9_9AGAR|nr:hypothetical protein GGX14DRAFT_609367 [Mycena pura]
MEDSGKKAATFLSHDKLYDPPFPQLDSPELSSHFVRRGDDIDLLNLYNELKLQARGCQRPKIRHRVGEGGGPEEGLKNFPTYVSNTPLIVFGGLVISSRCSRKPFAVSCKCERSNVHICQQASEASSSQTIRGSLRGNAVQEEEKCDPPAGSQALMIQCTQTNCETRWVSTILTVLHLMVLCRPKIGSVKLAKLNVLINTQSGDMHHCATLIEVTGKRNRMPLAAPSEIKI